MLNKYDTMNRAELRVEVERIMLAQLFDRMIIEEVELHLKRIVARDNLLRPSDDEWQSCIMDNRLIDKVKLR